MEYVGSRLDVFGVDVECLSMGLRSVVGRDHKDDAVAHAFVSLRRPGGTRGVERSDGRGRGSSEITEAVSRWDVCT
jgi:hypothetical protein